MRVVRLVFVALSINALGALQSSSSGSIEGVIGTRQADGALAPVEGATVELTGVIDGRVRSHTLVTRADGKFQFRNLPPAAGYQLVATRGLDYLPAQYGQSHPGMPGTSLTVEPGQQLKDIRVVLTPGAVVAGRIVGPDGRPYVTVNPQSSRRAITPTIWALKASYVDGRRILGDWMKPDDRVIGHPYDWRPPRLDISRPGIRWLDDYTVPLVGPAGKYGATGRAIATREDSGIVGGALRNGEFRISGLPPGQYYFYVQFHVEGHTQKVADGYFPGTGVLKDATPVTIATGEQVELPPFVLKPPRQLRRVSGRVIDGRTGNGLRSAQLTIAVPDSPPGAAAFTPFQLFGVPIEVSAGSPSSTGVFALQQPLVENILALPLDDSSFGADLYSGSYILRAVTDDGGRPLFGRMRLDVGDQPVDDVQLTVMPGFSVVGRVMVNGLSGNTSVIPGRLEVALRPLAGDVPEPPPSQVSLSGEFSFTDLAPGDYRVEVSPLTNAFVEAIRLGQADILNTRLTIDSQRPDTMEIVVHAGGGSIEGRIVGTDGAPAAYVRAVLIPDDPWRARGDLYKWGWTDGAGRFHLEGIAPGDYAVYAWELVEPGAWHDPHFMTLYEGQGRRVRIGLSDRSDIGDIQRIRAWR